jgi:hypothetical protein
MNFCDFMQSLSPQQLQAANLSLPRYCRNLGHRDALQRWRDRDEDTFNFHREKQTSVNLFFVRGIRCRVQKVVKVCYGSFFVQAFAVATIFGKYFSLDWGERRDQSTKNEAVV